MTTRYISPAAKGFRFRIELDEVSHVIQFVNGQYATDDEKLAKAIDAAVSKSAAISRYVRKVDRSAAEALAKQHAAEMARTGAHKGGVTAGAMQDAMKKTIHDRDVALQSQGGDSLVQEFDEKENLVLTEEGQTSPSPELANAASDTETKPKLQLGS